MKIKFPIPSPVLIFVIALGLVTSGCWSAHPHSAYRAIHQYSIDGNVDGVTTELLQHPDYVNLPEDHDLMPLHLAAQNCHSNVVVLLLVNGATIDARADDQATPLHLAAQEGCADVVSVLLDHSAKINLHDNQNRTPLKRAELWGQDDVVKLLKQRGGTE